MLHENIKRLRTEQGMSQEVLAERLHVVRQTVSKWEKGISVPDAEMLLQLAEVFGVAVGDLLGETEVPPEESDEPNLRQIAAQLSEINDRLAARSSRNRKILRIAAWSILSVAVLVLVWNGVGELIARYLVNQSVSHGAASSIGVIGGADGPTAVFVTHSGRSRWTDTAAMIAIIAVAGVALWKTKE